MNGFFAGGMAAVISGIKNIWNKVAELDSALTDLKKTTDATEAELKAFCFTSNDTAKQIGVPTAEIINAVTPGHVWDIVSKTRRRWQKTALS